MAADINLHGPLTAKAKTIWTPDGQTSSYVVIKESREIDAYGGLTIYCPSPESAEAIASAINAAWAQPDTEAVAA